MGSSPRTPGLPDAGAARSRVLILAYQIVPHDARYLKLRSSMKAAGFEVAATAPARPGRKIHPEVTAAPAGERPGHTLGAWLWARRVADGLVEVGERFSPDVIYTFDPEALPAATRLKQRTGALLVYDAHEFHEDEDPSNPARGAWVKRTELGAGPWLDGFVTVNQSIASLYRAERPLFPKALVVHNAVDPYPSTPYDGRLHVAANLPRATRILLYQGGVAPMRGLERLVAAVPLLSPDWRLVVMGDGPMVAPLRESADKERVHFMPPAPYAELYSWTSGASLGAILYEDTGRNQHFCSPNKLWEYAAAGVPALASDLPEIARVVRDKGTGFLIPPNATPDKIALAVNKISDDALITAAAHAKVFAANDTWSKQVAPLIDFLARPAQRRSLR